MAKDAVIAALGRPAHGNAGALEYVQGKRHLTVGLEAGKVVSIRAALWRE